MREDKDKWGEKGVGRQMSVWRCDEGRSGEKIAGHRRTSRTVCHRLVTPLPTSFVRRRGVAGRQARDKRIERDKKCAEVLQTRP